MNGQQMVRSLVRVEYVEKYAVVVVVPAWNPHKDIRVSLEGIPEDVRAALARGKRLFAHVNLDAKCNEPLIFEKWEMN